MVYAGSVIGFLGFDAVRQEKEWDEQVVALLRISGEVVANAIMRKRMEESLALEKDFLEKLLAVSREFMTVTDLPTLYRKVTTLSQETLKLDFSTLMVLADDGEHLIIRDTLGFPASMIDSFKLIRGQGLSTHVIEHKAPGTVTDFSI